MHRVELVGILNVTPDSFSDGGLYQDAAAAKSKAHSLFNQGASYIDIGAESTKPGAQPLTHEEEWERLSPVISEVIHSYPGHVSLDTYHPETVRKAAQEIGSFIINDVTAFNNPEMIEAAAYLRLPCVVSHLPEEYGQDIQAAHADKPVDSVEQVLEELMAKRAKLMTAGVDKDSIIVDPGIGFGKTAELNWKLLEFAALVPGIDVMIGYSRKRFLGDGRMTLEPNLRAGQIAVNAGARYLRVHDVAGHQILVN